MPAPLQQNLDKKSSMRLAPITTQSYDGMVEFCADFPNESRPLEYWKHRFDFWWESNPSYQQAFHKGWLLQDGERIVGCFAVIPSRMWIQGEERVVANTSLWRVLPEYRSHGMRLMIAAVKSVNDYHQLDTTSIEAVKPLLRMSRYVEIFQDVQRESLFIVRPPGFFLKGLLVVYRMFRNWFPDQFPQNPSLFLFFMSLTRYVQQVIRFYMASFKHTGSVRQVTTIGDEFNDLWKKTRHRFDFTVHRGADSIRWFAQKNPGGISVIVFAHFDNDECVRAYAMFRYQKTGHWPDSQSFYALDVWGDEPYDATLIPLLQYSVHFARKNGVYITRIPHYNPIIANACEKAGFSLEIEREMTGYCRFPNGERPPLNTLNAYLSRNMGDYAL